jgi:hypothetical protein
MWPHHWVVVVIESPGKGPLFIGIDDRHGPGDIYEVRVRGVECIEEGITLLPRPAVDFRVKLGVQLDAAW